MKPSLNCFFKALESNFTPYISAFLPYLYPALKTHEDTQLCTVAVGIIGDISRALGEQSAQYAASFMTVLLENLQSEVLNRNVKISILSCFGDIALAIGPEFEPYFETTMGVLRQAGAVEPNPLDYDLVDYVGQLREGILEAYTGIVTGLKKSEKCALSFVFVLWWIIADFCFQLHCLFLIRKTCSSLCAGVSRTKSARMR